MEIFQAIILGMIQGATEFIPVSSSAHLILVPWLLGWDIPSLPFDLMLHLGTLVAVLAYFWRDWLAMLVALVSRKTDDPNFKLMLLLIAGTIPAAVVGGIFEKFFEELFQSPAIASGFLLVTAMVLFISEKLGNQTRQIGEITLMDSILIGLAQACAIMPGLSRSGTTISAGLMRNLSREAAGKFSFMLSAPIIMGAGLFKLIDLVKSGIASTEISMMAIGFISAAVTGYAVIRWLLDYLRKSPSYIFAGYCFIVGLTCLAISIVRVG